MTRPMAWQVACLAALLCLSSGGAIIDAAALPALHFGVGLGVADGEPSVDASLVASAIQAIVPKGATPQSA